MITQLLLRTVEYSHHYTVLVLSCSFYLGTFILDRIGDSIKHQKHTEVLYSAEILRYANGTRNGKLVRGDNVPRRDVSTHRSHNVSPVVPFIGAASYRIGVMHFCEGNVEKLPTFFCPSVPAIQG